MSLRLRIEHGQDAGKTWRLAQPGVYMLGRGPDVSMRVLDMRVSKEHCEIQVGAAGGGVQAMLRDLGSTHGCQLNGQPVTKDVEIQPGDELRLGLTILRVLSDGEADDEAQPVAGRSADDKQVQGSRRNNGNDGKTKQTLAPDELVGKKLSGYTIERKIGAGGMGGVYVAEQTSLRRKVALKVLNEKFAADSAFVDQFVNEAQAAGALNHPNVVQVYDVGSADGRSFFSMELMPGGSVEDRLREEPIGWQEALNWFIDAANALIFAKKRDILHRDVKPDNLMLAEDGGAKLCDLGLAKKSEVKDLMDQGIIGTPHFISPEAIRRKNEIDHRTDLYSLGCSFFRVFTGKNPYPGKSVKEILLSHLNKPVPHVSGINRNVPKELDEIVHKLMQKDPAERYQTPDELLRALDKVRTQYRLESHGIKPASRKPLIIGAAAALIAIGVAIFFATKEPERVVIPRSKEQIQKELKTQRDGVKNRLTAYVTKAGGRLVDLDRERNDGQLDKGDNWKSPLWPRLVGDYRREADGWEIEGKKWQKALGEEDDDVVKDYYMKEIANLFALIRNARKSGQEIEDEVAEYRATEKQWNEGRTAALAEAEALFKGHSEKVRAHYEKKEFVQVERLLQPDVIKKMVDDLLARKVGRRPLLTPEDIKRLLDKYLPGDEKGRNRGKALIDEAVKSISNSADLALEEARKLIGDSPDPAKLAKAIELLTEARDKLPIKPDEVGVRTSAAYRRAYAKLDNAIKLYTDQKKAIEQADFRHDRLAYFKLVKKLWAQKMAAGLLRTFQLEDAAREAKLFTDVMRTRQYKELAQGWQARAEALVALLAHFQASFPDGWVSKNYWYLDTKGKRRKTAVKTVGPESMTWSKETRTYAELGARRMLVEFFYVQEKDEDAAVPRLTKLESQHHHGLAVLAELAGDYDRASTHYQKAMMGYGNDPMVGVIRARMGKLPKEREAAEKWLAVIEWLERQEAWERRYRAMVNSSEFDKETREKVVSDAAVLEQQLQTMQNMRYQLLEDPALAATAWGASLRGEPHPKVKYFAQEDLTPEPPKKPGGGGDKKPGEDGRKPGAGGEEPKPGGDGK